MTDELGRNGGADQDPVRRSARPVGGGGWQPRHVAAAVFVALVVGVVVGVRSGRDGGSGDRQTAGESTRNAPVLNPGQQGSEPESGVGVVVTVFGYTDKPSETGSDVQPPEGTVFSTVDAEVCARSVPFSFDPASLTLVVPQNTPVGRPSFAREPVLGRREIAPGQCVRGFVTYQLPAGIRPVAVIFNDGTRTQTWLVR